MTRHAFIKTFMVIMAILFFAVQGFSQAHAAANGGLDHSHDGVACDVALVAAEQTILTPPPPSTAPFIALQNAPKIAKLQMAAYSNFEGRAPPPRGPPL